MSVLAAKAASLPGRLGRLPEGRLQLAWEQLTLGYLLANSVTYRNSVTHYFYRGPKARG